MAEVLDSVEKIEGNVLTIAEIETSRDADYVTISVPEWGGNLRLQSVTSEMVVTALKGMESGNNLTSMMELLVQSFVDAQGKRQVTDPEKIKAVAVALLKKEVKVIERLMRAMMALNNISIKMPLTTEV